MDGYKSWDDLEGASYMCRGGPAQVFHGLTTPPTPLDTQGKPLNRRPREDRYPSF